MKNKKINTLWGSAFEESPDSTAIAYTSGRDVTSVPPADYNLVPYDLWLNRAHCVMLFKQKIISQEDAKVILGGLEEIEKLYKNGQLTLNPEKEDVHTNIESWLTEKYGIDSAGKLHTARSRNDQTAADIRLYMKDRVVEFIIRIIDLVDELIKQADSQKKTVLPGFTHHQHAMVTTLGHILLAFAVMLLRDIEKFKAVYTIIDENPLGNAASYGTSFPTNRNLTTQYLGFAKTDINSIDGITNRWEAEADVGYCIVSLMNHLSILSQTLILLSTTEFDMVRLSDQYSTGSSIMPQKKNPDTLEATKAKASLACGYLQSLISMGKSAFIGYNRDTQWTKYVIMDMIDECLPAPVVMKGIINTLKINKKNMRSWSKKGFIGATTLLEMMCSTYNLPFRQAKIIIEKAIKASKNRDMVEFAAVKKALADKNISIPITEHQVQSWQNPDKIINLYKSIGSAGLESMNQSLKEAEKLLRAAKKWLEEKIDQKEKAHILLNKEIEYILIR